MISLPDSSVYSLLSLFPDLKFVISPTDSNLLVIPKLMPMTFFQMFIDMYRAEKRCESPRTHMSPAEVKMGSVPPSCFAFHNVNKSSFHGLFNVTFSGVCWWFFFLTWLPGAVLKCYLVFPNTRTIQCAFQRNYTLDKLCLGMGYSCFGFEFIVLIGELQVYIGCDVFK